MSKMGNPNWKSLSGEGVSPHIKVHSNADTKAFLLIEAKKQNKSLSLYCREVLETHVDALLDQE